MRMHCPQQLSCQLERVSLLPSLRPLFSGEMRSQFPQMYRGARDDLLIGHNHPDGIKAAVIWESLAVAQQRENINVLLRVYQDHLPWHEFFAAWREANVDLHYQGYMGGNVHET